MLTIAIAKWIKLLAWVRIHLWFLFTYTELKFSIVIFYSQCKFVSPIGHIYFLSNMISITIKQFSADLRNYFLVYWGTLNFFFYNITFWLQRNRNCFKCIRLIPHLCTDWIKVWLSINSTGAFCFLYTHFWSNNK